MGNIKIKFYNLISEFTFSKKLSDGTYIQSNENVRLNPNNPSEYLQPLYSGLNFSWPAIPTNVFNYKLANIRDGNWTMKDPTTKQAYAVTSDNIRDYSVALCTISTQLDLYIRVPTKNKYFKLQLDCGGTHNTGVGGWFALSLHNYSLTRICYSSVYTSGKKQKNSTGVEDTNSPSVLKQKQVYTWTFTLDQYHYVVSPGGVTWYDLQIPNHSNLPEKTQKELNQIKLWDDETNDQKYNSKNNIIADDDTTTKVSYYGYRRRPNNDNKNYNYEKGFSTFCICLVYNSKNCTSFFFDNIKIWTMNSSNDDDYVLLDVSTSAGVNTQLAITDNTTIFKAFEFN